MSNKCTGFISNIPSGFNNKTHIEWQREFEKKFIQGILSSWYTGMDFGEDYKQTKIKEMKQVKVVPQQEESITSNHAVPTLCYLIDKKYSRVGIVVSIPSNLSPFGMQSTNPGWCVKWSDGAETSTYATFADLVKSQTSNGVDVMQVQK
jgi:hypothetical protein